MKFNKILLPNSLSKAHYNGWFSIIYSIKDDIVDDDSDVVLDTFVDSCFWRKNKEPIGSNWVGIVHAVVSDTDKIHNQTLSNLVEHPWFIQNKNMCIKLVTLCKYTADVLTNLTDIPVTYLYHPKFCDHFFDVESYFNNPQVNQAGFHARNFLKFAAFETKINKTMHLNKLCNQKHYHKYISSSTSHNISIRYDTLNNLNYIQNLVRSIGFAYYSDVAASNALLEHIMSYTPIIVNKHPAVVEYIGEDYLLFYEDIKHDPDKYLLDKKYIIQCSNYLKERSALGLFNINKFKQDLLCI